MSNNVIIEREMLLRRKQNRILQIEIPSTAAFYCNFQAHKLASDVILQCRIVCGKCYMSVVCRYISAACAEG